MNLVSSTWALNFGDALYESHKVFMGLATLAFFLNYFTIEKEEQILVKSLLWLILLCCVYPTYQMLRLGSLEREAMYQIHGFSEHRNLLSSLLMLFIPFTLYGILFFRRLYFGLSCVLIIWILTLILFLQVRSVYLGTAAGFFVFGIAFFIQADHGSRKKIFIIIGSLILLTLFVSLSGLIELNTNLGTYLHSESGEERLKVWKKTWLLIKENPMLGVGAANWQYNFMKFGISDIPNISLHGITFQRPHNDLLWVLAETGAICLIILLLKMGTIFYHASQEVFKFKNIKVLLFFSFLCALITDAFFSFPKERITHIVFSCLLLALLLRNLQPGKLLVQYSRIPVYLGILILVIGLFCGVARLFGEYNTKLLYAERIKQNHRAVVGLGRKAISVFFECDPTSTPVSSYVGEAYFFLNQADSSLFFSEKAYRLSPYDFEVLSNYGLALERMGKREESKFFYKEALRINEHFEPARFNLAITEYNLRNYQSAFQLLKSIPESEQKYPLQFAKIKEKVAQD